MQWLFEGSTQSGVAIFGIKYGLVLISMLIIILTCTFFVGEKGSHYMAERPDF